MNIIYIALFVMTCLFIVANAMEPPRVKAWAWGIVLTLWVALIAFVGNRGL